MMELCKDKKNCSACGACLNICPKSAITMKEDEFGFLYPQIDTDRCIDCKACIRVCDWRRENIDSQEEKESFYAAVKDENKLMLSTSGGVFSVLSEQIINSGGIVCGATLTFDDVKKEYKVNHILVNSIEKLQDVLGSKYVQSDIGYSYSEIKKFLELGTLVLFCGTPCQVAGLKNYLGRDYDNLLLIDIICHGVPSLSMFNDFMKHYSQKRTRINRNITFRQKKKRRNSMEFFYFSDGKKSTFCKNLSYYYLFLEGHIYRESCYKCKYACKDRTGDITLGDAWGLTERHSELLKENGGVYNKNLGVSSVIINTFKGKKAFDKIEQSINKSSVSFNELQEFNHQLQRPTELRTIREEILKAYCTKGYCGVEEIYKKSLSIKQKFLYKIYIPLKVKVQALRNYCQERTNIINEEKTVF